MAELLKKFVAHSSLPERDRSEYLRLEICATMDEVGGYVPGRRRALADYRDFLIRQHVAERPKANSTDDDVNGVALVAQHPLDTSQVSPSQEVSLVNSTTPLQQASLEKRTVPLLDVALINRWLKDKGYGNKDLVVSLKMSSRAVSSLRNNGLVHGMPAIIKLANLMDRDPEDLYLP